MGFASQPGRIQTISRDTMELGGLQVFASLIPLSFFLFADSCFVKLWQVIVESRPNKELGKQMEDEAGPGASRW